MQGALDRLGAPVTATALEPFAEPDSCVAHLARTPAAEPSGAVRRRTADSGPAVLTEPPRRPHAPTVPPPGGERPPPMNATSAAVAGAVTFVLARDGAGDLLPGGPVEVPRPGGDDPGRAGHRPAGVPAR